MRRNRHDRVLVAERAKIKIGQAIPRNPTNNGGDSFRKTCSTSSARQNHISPNFALKRNTLSPRQIRTSTRAKKSKNIYTQKKRKRPHPTQFFFEYFCSHPTTTTTKRQNQIAYLSEQFAAQCGLSFFSSPSPNRSPSKFLAVTSLSLLLLTSSSSPNTCSTNGLSEGRWTLSAGRQMQALRPTRRYAAIPGRMPSVNGR